MTYDKEVVDAYISDNTVEYNKFLKENRPLAVLFASIQEGNYFDVSFRIANIPEPTFYLWKREKPEFAEAVKKADAYCQRFHVGNIKSHSKDAWTASAWFLERKYPDKFKEKKEQEIKGQVTLEELLTNGETPIRNGEERQ
jgi:hypothetical protein